MKEPAPARHAKLPQGRRCLLAVLLAILPAAPALAATPAPLPADAKAYIDKNCTGCHRSAKAPAGLDLTSLSFDLADAHTQSRWVRIHDAVRDGAMPPGSKDAHKQPDRQAFLKAIATPLVTHESQRAATQGRSVLRRLNRYEYENTIRDLLSAPWLQVRDGLPEDGLVHRLNKSGQALDVSHVQMSRYMETADQALRAVLDASGQVENSQRYYARDQKRFINRMRYSPFNRHPERATIPILGFEAQPDVLAEKVPLSVGDKDPQTRELEAFATPASTYVGNEYHFDGFAAPVGGQYRLRFNVYSLWIHTVFGPEGRGDKVAWWRPNREKTSRGRTTEPLTMYALSKGGEKRLLGTFDVGPEPAIHELNVHLLPGEQILPDAARLFRSRPGFVGSPEATAEGMPGIAYRWMEVAGPVQNVAARESFRRLFGNLAATRDKDNKLSVMPTQAGDAERLLRQFMARAYRRPPKEQEVQRYLAIIRERLVPSPKGNGPDFAEAMIAGYTAVLCSPGFLYLEEEPGPLNAYALASRLSYFLWNAPPDQELRTLAAKGTLVRPAVLRAQTNRLLDDPRSQDFVAAFLDYWLDLRKLSENTPDQTLYPEYYLDDLLLESAAQETRLFFQALVRRNLPVSNLIESNFTMVNSHLARHYNLPPVEGVAMREIALPPNSVRGGLLTQASVLKVTANGTTTSPVLRGVWIMERIVGDPPSPPPPGTPAVEPDTRGATTIRQQLDKHRSVRSCAVCHNKIDPPGFALESFDVLGAWRDRYRSTEEGEPVQGIGKNGHAFTFKRGQPVDASGQLATGDKFQDVVELKRLLLKDERQISRNVVSQFVAYGTGAPPGFGDRAEVERILSAGQRDRYGLRTLIHQVVQSKLFTTK